MLLVFQELSLLLDDASNCTHSSKVFCRDNFISYKNTLQEYCQKRHLPMPLYQFEKTDYGFKATVQFDQKVYSSQTCQPSVKDAEKRVAFEALKIEQVLPSNAIFGMTVQIELPSMSLLMLYINYGAYMRIKRNIFYLKRTKVRDARYKRE